MAYIDSFNLSTNLDFRNKVLIAIVSASKDINGESPSDPPNPDRDEKRKQLAIHIISDPHAFVERFALLVVSNPAINSNSSDGDIQFTVNQVFDDVAGV